MKINHKIGIHFCGGNESLHVANLKDFYKTSEINQEHLFNDANTGHLQEYLISVHALKGISRMIGAEDLSDIAYEHEMKSRNNDTEYIRREVQSLLNEWDEVLEEIEEYVDDLFKSTAFESNGIILSRNIIDVRISQILDDLCAYENDEAEKKLEDLLRYCIPEHIYSQLLRAYELTRNFEYTQAIESLEIID